MWVAKGLETLRKVEHGGTRKLGKIEEPVMQMSPNTRRSMLSKNKTSAVGVATNQMSDSSGMIQGTI
jgi:hypothetical protein